MKDTTVAVQQPTVSVVVLTYNNFSDFCKTYDSIIYSTTQLSLVEVVIVNGGLESGISGYVNDEVKLQLLSGVVYLNEPDRGIYDAMNKGLHLARGKHIIYMNSGDCFHAGGLAAFLSQPRDPAVLYYGDAEFYQGGALSFGFKANMRRARDFLRHNCFSHQAIFYPTALLQSLGGYRLEYTISADFDLTWRCWRSGCRFEQLGEVIADCELGGISCQRGLQSYADRLASFQASGAWFYAGLLKAYYPIFLAKNRLVHQLEGSRLLALYRKYKVR